jgi:phospholipid N-methyltransferase
VNENHAKLLGSPEWAAFLHDEVLPAVVCGVDLGDDMLEIGPGPGAATEWLRHRVRRLVTLEREPDAVAALRALRPGGTLVGSDSLASDRLHHFHAGDTYNPVEPAALLTRLQTLGFAEITITVGHALLFRARKERT